MHHNKRPPAELTPRKMNRSSSSEWSGSQKSSARGSSKKLCASSNQTPCFARLALFLRSSQSNRSISRCYLDMLTLARGRASRRVEHGLIVSGRPVGVSPRRSEPPHARSACGAPGTGQRPYPENRRDAAPKGVFRNLRRDHAAVSLTWPGWRAVQCRSCAGTRPSARSGHRRGQRRK
jgi:hypothetical protein